MGNDLRHDWIFNVLEDLQSYALRNGLPRLAEAADQARDVARAEMAMLTRASARKSDNDQ